MITLFRKFFSSKVGIALTLAFLGIIALAFASSDVLNTGFGGGLSSSSRVAVVGDEKIDAAQLQSAATNALEQARQQDPRMAMPAFVADGGLERVLDQLVDRATLYTFGRQIGLRAGDRLVDSEILQIPAFRGPDGKFNRQIFLNAIGQQNMTEAAVRKDVAMTMMARQLAAPVMLAPVIPNSYAATYASLLRERRTGAVARIPSTAFAPAGNPTDAQLQAFYTENRSNFIRPERRVIRFATFGPEALKSVPEPTEAQIAARYARDRAQYAASERRDFTQVVAASQTLAQQIAADVAAGKSLDEAARARGLATSKAERRTREELGAESSAAVAQAGFGLAQGQLSAPARGGLGWYVLRLDRIDRQPERTLAQVRGTIADALRLELRRAAFADYTARIEEELDNGTSLADLARELGLAVTTTAPAAADGAIYGKPGETVPQALAPVLATAFEMEEDEPQLAPLGDPEQFAMFDVTEITPSAPAPLAEIREDVIAAWKLDRGALAARQAADRIIARVGKGMPLAQAVAAEQVALPPVQPVDLAREQMARLGQVPPPLALMFSMAENSVKRLDDGGDRGWYVVRLDDISAPQVAQDDPIIAATLRQLGTVAGQEYAEQFVAAVQREVKVERNEEAVAALRRQLAGTGDN